MNTAPHDAPLVPDMNRHEAAVHLFAQCLDDVHRLDTRWRETPGEEELHDFRVGIRRVRVLLRVFGREASGPHARRLGTMMKTAADRLGRVRDIDVMLGLLARAAGDGLDTAAETERLTGRRAEMLEEAKAVLRGEAWDDLAGVAMRFMQELMEREPDGPDRDTIRTFLAREVKTRMKKAVRSSRSVKSTNADELHAFRKKLRRIRYLGDVLGPVANGRQRRLFAAVHRCEQSLGRCHDIDLLLASPAPVSGWSAPLVAYLEKRRSVRLKKFRKRWKKCLVLT